MGSPTTPLPADPPRTADEMTTLVSFLDFYRAVFIRKLEGMDDVQARTIACPPSDLTPLGLVRHMAEVERGWFRRGLGESIDHIYTYEEDPDEDFHAPPGYTLADGIDLWRGEVDAARRNMATANLDDVATGRPDRPLTYRWILVHMIEEYARHCGHLDLIAEAIDGRKGD